MTEPRAGVNVAMTNGGMVASAGWATGMAKLAESGSRMKKPKKAELMAEKAELLTKRAELLTVLDSLNAENVVLKSRLDRHKAELATARQQISNLEERISSMEERFERITLLAAPSNGRSTAGRMVAESGAEPTMFSADDGGSGVWPAAVNGRQSFRRFASNTRQDRERRHEGE